MWGWIAKGLRPAAGAAGGAAAAAAVGLATLAVLPSGAAATPVSFAVPGGKVRILDVPRRDRDLRDSIVRTVSEELANAMSAPVPSIDPDRCPTGEVLITVEKQATLQRKWAEVSTQKADLAGMLVRGTPCRIWLGAQALHKLDEARVCNLVRHELGHARGLDHTAGGLMAASIPVLPIDGCDWAESAWLN